MILYVRKWEQWFENNYWNILRYSNWLKYLSNNDSGSVNSKLCWYLKWLQYLDNNTIKVYYYVYYVYIKRSELNQLFKNREFYPISLKRSMILDKGILN